MTKKFIINNVKVNINESFKNNDQLLSKILKFKVFDVVLNKRSIDSRKKGEPFFICSFIFCCNNTQKALSVTGCSLYENKEYRFLKAKKIPNKRPIIVGFGPAGMFAALTFIYAGIKPIIIEKGACVEKREELVNDFLNGKALDLNSNVQFGEGGAGTFSDGKLNTGIKDERIKEVLKLFHKFGAKEEILYSSAPHIGTDILKDVVRNIRNELLKHGAEIFFETECTDIIINNNKVEKIICKCGKEFLCDTLILAIGNSARDMFKLLHSKGVNMSLKPFSVGVRIEHEQALINNYKYKGYKGLPAADYKLAVHLKDGRGVYTFCMCPGGYVINSSSEKDGVVTNGMSFSARDGKMANSALLVSVLEQDLDINDPLSGIKFQKEIEQKAYKLAKGHFPISQRVGDFLKNTPTKSFDKIKPTAKPMVKTANISDVLPPFVIKALKEALPLLDKKIKGFCDENAILTAPETRSSSPVRILRNEEYMTNISGIYPAGEGAGYAGGITSSAVDGIKVAESLVKNF